MDSDISLTDLLTSNSRALSKDAVSNWIEVGWDGTVSLLSAAWALHLDDGSRLLGNPLGGGEDRLDWELPCGTNLDVDLNGVRGISRLGLGMPIRATEKDTLVLGGNLENPGDPREGWCLAVEEKGVVFEGPAGESRHGWSQVRELRLLVHHSDSPNAGFWIYFRGGGHMRVSEIMETGEGFDLESKWVKSFYVPRRAVERLAQRDAGVRELDLSLSPSIRFPEGSADWTPKCGFSVEGRPISVAGWKSALGWGTQAPTSLVFSEVGPGAFVGRVGIDDEVASFKEVSDVLFELVFDGKVIAQSPYMGFGDTPFLMRGILPSRGELELRTTSLNPVPTGTHGDWLDPVIKTLK